jgi:hypothetical protein
MAKTKRDLLRRARRAIDKKEEVAYDVAAEHCQMLKNVAHMKWLTKAVANEIIGTTKSYQHLDPL